MNFFFIGIAILLLSGLFSLFVRETRKGAAIACGSLISGALIAVPCLESVCGGKIFSACLEFNQPIGLLNFTLDPLSAFFSLIIVVMSSICTVYAAGYMASYCNQGKTVASHFLFLALLTVSMIMLTVVRNYIAFLIVWELMSLSSFFLVIFENEKKEVLEAGTNYLVMMHVSVIFLIAGFALLANISGSADFADFHKAIENRKDIADIAFSLLFAGFAVKAGFMPLHSWLPAAHPAAPSHVSGLMSGVMIKLGIFGILLTLTITGTPSLQLCFAVMALSLLSAVLGMVCAIAQNDLKRLLAYSSIENIGIIGIGIGTGLLGLSYGNNSIAALGFGGALLHVMNHSIFKGLLFYGAGTVYLGTHTRNMDNLGGLIKKMPFTGFFFLAGSVAICAMPPLNGFISEFLIYLGMLESAASNSVLFTAVATLSIGLLAFVGAMAMLCFVKVFSTIFLGHPRRELPGAEAGPGMLIPMGILAGLCLLTGLLPQFVLKLAELPVVVITGRPFPGEHIYAVLNNITLVFFILILVFALLLFFRKLLLKGRTRTVMPTWGCGYRKATSRMQYTASSFAMPFLDMVRPLLKKETRAELPSGLFPGRAFSRTHFSDVFEACLLKPFAAAVTWFVSRFSWVQNGSMQQYIFYGLCFLVFAVLWVLYGGF